MSSNDKNQGFSVLVVGSSRFDSREKAYLTMDILLDSMEGLPVRNFASGSCTGVDAFVKDWCLERGIPHVEINWTESQSYSSSFFQNTDIDAAVFSKTKAYAQAVSALGANSVDLVLAMPGPEGDLGFAARNMCKIAESLELNVVNGADFLHDMSDAIEELCSDEVCSAPAKKMRV